MSRYGNAGLAAAEKLYSRACRLGARGTVLVGHARPAIGEGSMTQPTDQAGEGAKRPSGLKEHAQPLTPEWLDGAKARAEAVDSLLGETTIEGPLKYPGDLHPCFRLMGEDRLIATFFAADGDLDVAEALAGYASEAARTAVPALVAEVERLRPFEALADLPFLTLTIATMSDGLCVMLFDETTGLWDRCRVGDLRAEAAKEAQAAQSHAEGLEAMIRSGLAKIDAATAACPVRSGPRAPMVCPKCGADHRQGCGLADSAEYAFVLAARELSPETPTDASSASLNKASALPAEGVGTKD